MADKDSAEAVEATVDVQTEPVKPTGRQRRDGASSKAQAASKSKGKSKAPLTPEVVEAATAGWERIIGMLLLGAQQFAPRPYAPTPQEADGIQHPLAHILGRHYPLPEITGDAEDAFALIIALGSYGARVYADLLMQGVEQAAPPPPPPTPQQPRHAEHAQPVTPAPAPASVAHEEAQQTHEYLRAVGVPQPGEPQAASHGDGMGIPQEQLVGYPEDVLRTVYEATLNGPMVQGQNG